MATRKSHKPKSQHPPPPSAPVAPPVPDQPEPAATLAAAPVPNRHAAGIDVGRATHWACVGSTPDGTSTVREVPSHTPGLRELVAWLRACAVTTVALEASGAYGHVLYLEHAARVHGFQVSQLEASGATGTCCT